MNDCNKVGKIDRNLSASKLVAMIDKWGNSIQSLSVSNRDWIIQSTRNYVIDNPCTYMKPPEILQESVCIACSCLLQPHHILKGFLGNRLIFFIGNIQIQRKLNSRSRSSGDLITWHKYIGDGPRDLPAFPMKNLIF